MTTPTCTAALFVEPNRPLDLTELPLPTTLAMGEMLIRVTCCTVCGSDLHTHAGRRSGPSPCVLGHEIVGIVTDIGSRPPRDLRGNQVRLGDRLVWSVAVGCGQCRCCGRGIPQKCDRLRKYGHHAIEPSWQLSGGLAQYCHLVEGTQFVIIDDSVDEETICPASCATATVAAALGAAGDVGGLRVLIFGAGMLGLTAAAMARSQGAESVAICDVTADRLALTGSFGCHASMLFEDLDGEYDIVLEMSGASVAAEAALRVAAVGGAIVLVGAVMPVESVAMDPQRVVRRLLSIHGVHNYTPADLVTAVDFLTDAGRKFPFSDLVACRFRLGAVNEAIDYAHRHRPIRLAVGGD